jgi:hypothetical protein
MNRDRTNYRGLRLTAIAFATMLVVAGSFNRLVFGWRLAFALPVFGLFIGGLGLHYYDGYKLLRARAQTGKPRDER